MDQTICLAELFQPGENRCRRKESRQIQSAALSHYSIRIGEKKKEKKTPGRPRDHVMTTHTLGQGKADFVQRTQSKRKWQKPQVMDRKSRYINDQQDHLKLDEKYRRLW